MRKQRQFRPVVEDARLEDRVVLSHGHSHIIAAAHAHVVPPDPPHAKLPVATESEVKATLRGIHRALVSYSNSMTAFFNSVIAQLNAGTINQTEAANLLGEYEGTPKFNKLFYDITGAAGRLPYGAGFNGFVTSTPTGPGIVTLPSGAPDLVTLLTFNPVTDVSGPIDTLSSNFFNALYPEVGVPDFSAVGQTISHSAIVTAYQESVSVVQQYIGTGVSQGDFTFRR